MKRLILALLLAAAATPAAAHHDRDRDDDRDDDGKCRSIDGPFTSVLVPPPACTSPIGLCTHGILEGDLDSTYDFTFDTLVPAGDPNDPQKFVYTGTSVITMDRGGAQMFSDDHGEIHFDPTGESAFVTTVMVARGTKQFRHATGTIVASGQLSFVTGQASGSYTGNICK